MNLKYIEFNAWGAHNALGDPVALEHQSTCNLSV